MTDRAIHTTTTVRVRDLALLADVGINPDEVGRRQPLMISVELTINAETIGSIDQTIDYRKVASAAEDLARHHVPLIETFARLLGEECLRFPNVEAAHVSIDKPFALARGLAGVHVVMKRK